MSIMVFLLVWMMVLMIVFSSSEWTVVKIVFVFVEDKIHNMYYTLLDIFKTSGVQNSSAPGGAV